MRIGIVHYLLNVKGGGERVCLHLCQDLISKGYEVAIATENMPGPESFDFFQKFDDYYIGHKIPFPFSLYRNTLNYLNTVYYMVEKFHPDIVVFTQASSILQFRLLNRLRIPAILYCHWPGHIIAGQRGEYAVLGDEYESDEYGEPHFRFRPVPLWQTLYYAPYNILTGRTDEVLKSVKLVTNSYFTKKAVEKLWKIEPYKVIYPPVDTTFFSPDFNLKQDKLILMVARYSYGKGHLEALEIMRDLKKEHEDVKLVMAGYLDPKYYAFLQKIRKTVEDYCLEDNVEIKVDLREEELLNLYQRASILLHPIGTEHFGISIVEAMGCGTPVVGRRGGGLIEIVEDGKTGFLFRDFREAADKIRFILNDGCLRRQMGYDALRRSKLFDKELFKEQMEQVILETALKKG